VRGAAVKRAPALAVLALLAAAAAGAQEPGTVDVATLPTSLAGEWLFRVGHDPSWASPFRERRNWQRVAVPGAWEKAGFAGYNGHAWYRLPFFLHSQLAGETFGIDLGTIGDVDEVFVNGRRVGGTGSFPPRFSKATLAHRFYLIPSSLLRFGEHNEIAVHVYNAARFGGLLGPPPELDRFAAVLQRQVLRDILVYGLFIFLVTLAAAQLVFLATHRERLEHLAMALLLVALGAFMVTYASWGPASAFGHNLAFRLNVVFFVASVALFPSVILRLARRPLPPFLVALQTLLALGAAFALAWPEEADLYLWIYVAEAAIAVNSVVTVQALSAMFRRGSPWAAWIALTTVGVLTLVGMDVLVDLGLAPRRLVLVGELWAPLALVPFAVVLSLASGYEWARARWGEPADEGVGILSRDRFLGRLSREIEPARLADTSLAVALIRVDTAEAEARSGEVLSRTVLALRRALRQIDSLGRHDHSTFLVLLAETEERMAVAALERLRKSLVEAAGRPAGTVRITAGVAQLRPTRHTAAAELLEEAEAALFAALAEGGDRTATAP